MPADLFKLVSNFLYSLFNAQISSDAFEQGQTGNRQDAG
jgi:hypothetical protein